MKPVKMNCLGDSITYGYLNEQGDAMEKSYPIVLKEILKLDIIRNYGINGSTIADGENPMYIRYQDMSDEADIGCEGDTIPNQYGYTLEDVNQDIMVAELGSSNPIARKLYRNFGFFENKNAMKAKL